MALAVMTLVKINSIAGKHPTHNRGNWRCPGAEQDVEMIPKQRPGITRSAAFHQVLSQTLQETISVLIVSKYGSTLNASGNDVMESLRSIDARFTWYILLIPEINRDVSL